ncbi:hypothetical protein QK437_31230, partial [Pseudomonas aeruginosa]|nr:hypothetical protein [Pseudomonas aeruginosa]
DRWIASKNSEVCSRPEIRGYFRPSLIDVLSGNSSREHAENIRAAGQIAGVRMLRPRRSMYELFEDLKISSFGRPAPKEGQ